MNKEEYKIATEALFADWITQLNYCKSNFTRDGIFLYPGSSYENWQLKTPKILFLAREDWAGGWSYDNDKTPFIVKDSYSFNLWRWRYLIYEMFENLDKIPDNPSNEVLLGIKDDGMAIIEVKKNNEGNKNSNLEIIKCYAEKDRSFLKKQFELISPNIVFCCGTGDSRGTKYDAYKTIYYDEEFCELIRIHQFSCHKHGDRLIIYFRHPSYIFGKREKIYFDILHKLLKDGNVFEHFGWAKQAN